MKNVIYCHFCVTRWICRVVQVVQFFFLSHTIHACTHTHFSDRKITLSDFRSIFLLYSAVLALLEDTDTFLCIFLATTLWLQQESHQKSQQLFPTRNTLLPAINGIINTTKEFDRTEI